MRTKVKYILLGVMLAFAGQAMAVPQVARPSGTIASTGWSIVNESTHHGAIDEVSHNDGTDYVESSTLSTLEVNLSSVSDPGSYIGNHTIRLWVYSNKSGLAFDVQLIDNGTPFGSATSFNPTRNAWAEIPFTIPDASGITDYSTLSLRITITSTANGYLQVTQAELEVPELLVTAPTVINPSVDLPNVTSDTATLGGEVTNIGGEQVSERGVYWSTTPGFTPPGQGTKDSTAGGPWDIGTFTESVTPLPAGSQVYFRAFAANSAGEGFSAESWVYTEPDTQEPTATIDNAGSSDMRINWTNGHTGDGVIVLMHENGAVDAAPVDGTVYNADSSWPNGDQVGTGNRVMYVGSATNNVTVTDLTPGSTYHVAVYAYTGTGSGQTGINYLQTNPARANQLIAGPPALTTVTSSSVDQTAADLNITVFSNGGQTISQHGTMWKVGSAPAPTDNPTSLGTYSPTSGVFTDSRSSLPEASHIYYQGYATNSFGTSYSDVGQLYTEPATQASAITFPTGTSELMTINWTAGSGDGALVVARASSAVNVAPTDEVEHAFSSVFGTEDLGGGNYVVFRGPGTTAEVSNLTPGVTYHFAVFEYKGSGEINGGINYNESLAPSNRNSQLIVGAPQISGLTVTTVDQTTATIQATVDSDGGAGSLDARGTVWNITGDPVIENQLPEGGTSTGTFTQDRIDLPEGSVIYYRGYTTNSFGTTYTPSKYFYTEPATQASAISFLGVNYGFMTVEWTRGSGDGVVVVAREGSAVTAVPTDETIYDPNTVFGDVTAEIATGEYVVYVGGGTSVVVGGLTPQTTYHFAVYEYKGSGAVAGGINYNEDLSAANRGSQITADPPIGHNYSNAIQCDQCHALHSGTVPQGAGQVTACVTQCHNVSGPASSMPIAETALHSQGGIDCGGCHEVHNGAGAQANLTTTNTHAGGTTQKNLKLLRGNVAKYAPGAIEPMIYHFDYTVDDTHLAFPDGDERVGSGWSGPEGGYDGVCQACHSLSTTNYHTNNNQSGHASERTHPAEQPGYTNETCIDCHFHSTGFQPEISQNLACLDANCHAQAKGVHRAVDSEFSMTSHHITGTHTDDDCLVCHDNSTHPNSGAGIPLRHPDTGATITINSPLTRDRNSDQLETETVTLQNDFCMPCHDADGATATSNGPDPTHPFSSGAPVPPVYEDFDPANHSHHAVRAPGDNPKLSAVVSGQRLMLPPWNQDGPDDHDMITCFDCHEINGHGSTNQRMLRGFNINWTSLLSAPDNASMIDTEAGNIENFCYLCHDPAILRDERTPENFGSFLEHPGGQGSHEGGSKGKLGCMTCHAGIRDFSGSGQANGARTGLIHGGNHTWNWNSQTYPADLFIMGGYMGMWWYDSTNAGCYGGLCNHESSEKSYPR